uniref:Uncharacterized protein n=1 Tax=Arundo donax TaxID=35708 RepID=A0A0A9DFV1_ARUDO
MGAVGFVNFFFLPTRAFLSCNGCMNFGPPPCRIFFSHKIRGSSRSSEDDLFPLYFVSNV